MAEHQVQADHGDDAAAIPPAASSKSRSKSATRARAISLRYFGGRWVWLPRSSARPSKSKRAHRFSARIRQAPHDPKSSHDEIPLISDAEPGGFALGVFRVGELEKQGLLLVGSCHLKGPNLKAFSVGSASPYASKTAERAESLAIS